VVATRKDERLEGLKFHIVQQMNLDKSMSKSYVVAVDAVGAGMGEVVLFATGSAARQTPMTDNRPVDGIIMAIVDVMEIGGKIIYQKG
ncbi:MAG: ethanolamine utilization protein EutN, partial [Candidatus Schekmanbacteria bacterium RBG_13_48_7]